MDSGEADSASHDGDAESVDVRSVVCVIHSLNGGGAERVMAGLVSRLAQRGYATTLITYDDGKQDRHEVAAAVQRRFLRLPSSAGGIVSRLMGIRRRIKALRGAIENASADVVIAFCDRNNIDTILAARRSPVRVVVCERSDPARQSLGFFWNRVRRLVYRRADTIVTLTEAARAYFSDLLNRVEVIPSAVDVPPVSSDRSKAIEHRRIVGAGRLEKEKGFDRLIEAFSVVVAKYPGWSLEIFGTGSQEQALKALCESLGLSGKVRFCGWVQPIWEPLSQATMFCLPSRYEGFPSALLEAMALGVPSISVDCESGPRQIVRTGENGMLVEPDMGGLVQGMERWINDAQERERIGLAGKEVIETFGWERMVDRFQSLIDAD